MSKSKKELNDAFLEKVASLPELNPEVKTALAEAFKSMFAPIITKPFVIEMDGDGCIDKFVIGDTCEVSVGPPIEEVLIPGRASGKTQITKMKINGPCLTNHWEEIEDQLVEIEIPPGAMEEHEES